MLQRDRISVLLTIVLMALTGWAAWQLSADLAEYRSARDELAAVLNFDQRLLDVNEWLNKSTEKGPKLIQAEAIYQRADEAWASGGVWTMVGLAALGVAVFLSLLLTSSVRTRILQIITISLVSLLIGLSLPMLEIAAYLRDLTIDLNIDGGGLIAMALGTSKTFQGDIYFYYQSKSILEIIRLLFQQGNLVVALSILAFSIMIPVVKLLSTGYLIIVNPSDGLSRYQRIVLLIGKWSMADVFVAGIFLSSLAFRNMNPGLQTDSRVLPGLYFFLAYCLLSIGSSMMIGRYMADRD